MTTNARLKEEYFHTACRTLELRGWAPGMAGLREDIGNATWVMYGPERETDGFECWFVASHVPTRVVQSSYFVTEAERPTQWTDMPRRVFWQLFTAVIGRREAMT